MVQQLSEKEGVLGRRYALCIGIGTYMSLINRSLRYAVADAMEIAERLADPKRGNFAVRVLAEPAQTTTAALNEAVEQLLNAPDRQVDDLTLIYFSCHGDICTEDNTFCLLPSDAIRKDDGTFEQTTLIGIRDFARWFSWAKTQNIVVLLDVCHSGGAGEALQHFKLELSAGPNFFIIGAARQDQVTRQSSLLQHGLFTHCLLRAFEQPPTEDGWLTISQIQNFVSDEMSWFAKDQPIQIQSWSVSVKPNLALLRNPCYPELSPLPPLWNVPLRRNMFFTGQDDLLFRLASLLQSEQKTALTQPQAIRGLGGIGKTQLALEYAYRHRQDYHAILWGRADTYEALIFTFVSIAYLLDLPQKDEKDQMAIVEAVKAWLAGRSKWLLILDNADELALVKEFIPSAFRGHLLLTTRAQSMGGLAHHLDVETMTQDVGALLLLRRAGRVTHDTSLDTALSSTDAVLAQEIAKEMGGLPLALDQAGAYIEETGCNFSDYLNLYRTHKAALLSRRGGLTGDHPKSVATTWSLSFEKVEHTSPIAADLLRLCAYLAPDIISEEIMMAWIISQRGRQEKGRVWLPPFISSLLSKPRTVSQEEASLFVLNEAISVLLAYSFLHRNAANKIVSIHRLVQTVVRESIPTKNGKHWKQQAVLAVSSACPDLSNLKYWETRENWFSHAQVCAVWVKQEQMNGPKAASLLNQAGFYLYECARYREAESLLEQALAINERESRYSGVVENLNNLAAVIYLQGRDTEAESLLYRAFSICEQRLSPEHPLMAKSLNNLAVLSGSQGKGMEREVLISRALAIQEQQLETNHPDMVPSLVALADVYQAQGKYAEAEALMKRAIAIGEQKLGAEHPYIANSLVALADIYKAQGKYAEVELLVKRAIAIREQKRGSDHPETAEALDRLADLYQAQGKYAEAEPVYRRSIEIYEKIGVGYDHRFTATAFNNLAILYYRQGKYTEAEPLYHRALAITEQQVGPTHPDTALIFNNLAKLYRAQGKYEEAETLCQRALSIYEQHLGTDHSSTALSLITLTEIYRDQGQYAKAEPLYRRALAIYEQRLGPKHLNTQTTRRDYASFLRKMGRNEEAKILEEEQ